MYLYLHGTYLLLQSIRRDVVIFKEKKVFICKAKGFDTIYIFFFMYVKGRLKHREKS